MKFLRIFLCVAFIFAIAACGGKKDDPYDYPDDDTTTTPGEIGDQCKKNSDCREGLVCIGRKCTEPAPDKDDSDDTDTETEDSDTDTDTNNDDTDTDTNTNDGDTDTNIPDEDKPDDSDTQPDEDSDTIPYTPECGNAILDYGEECDNGLENSDEPGIIGVTCRMNCVFARCGDGIIDNGEACDDNNTKDGDYCSSNCETVTGYCGDGVQQNNEMCDPGINPYCADDCSGITGYCGDGKKQSNEECDNAEPTVGAGEGIGPYYCNINCSEIIGRCGDSEVQINEVCDSGTNNGKYGYCNTTCSGKAAYCGDGILQSDYEKCDDGNNVGGDYCSSNCQISYGSCGDGIIQSFEACDKATFGNGIGAYCSDDCKQILGRCGDGEQNGNEECDYGETGENYNGNLYCPYGSFVPCDVCTAACKKIAGKLRYCGDGEIQAGEACDNADPNVGVGEGTGAYCSSDCKTIIGRCGDGIVQSFEACDNATFGDGIGTYCSDDCKQIVGRCGDGEQNGNEECDYGETGEHPNGDLNCAYGERNCIVCTSGCKKAAGKTSYCGDTKTDSANGELCDDGANNGTYTITKPGRCNSNCKGRGEGGFCGDNNTDTANGEECDNGTNNGATNCAYGEQTCKVCTSECKEIDGNTAYCGDGIKQENEACDKADFGDGIGAYCSDNCQTVIGYCGDGTQQSNENCDDGNTVNGDYCSADCQTVTGSCGDGTQQSNENCDDGENNGKYNLNQPQYCNSQCSARNSGYCGDSIKQNSNCGGDPDCVEMSDAAEDCDHGNNNGKTACEYGEINCFVCSLNCTQSNGTTSYCGDGKIDRSNGEECDDGNTADGDYCSSNCKTVTGYCGDGIKQTNEECDDGNISNGDYCSADCQTVTGSCGDGTKQNNEVCDNADPTVGEHQGIGAYCSNDCQEILGSCGDGIVQLNEICDKADFGEGTGSYCSDDCLQSLGRCGDNNTDANEFCDDGDGVNGTYGNCSLDCQYILECGDGIPNGNEKCDNGPLNGTYDHCNEYCTGKTGFCGDGLWQNDDCNGEEGCHELSGGDEECDNGYLNGHTDCTYGFDNCEVCTTECKIEAGKTAYCGDKKIQKGTAEACDAYVALDPVNNKLCDENVTENCCEVTAGADEICDEGEDNGKYNHCTTNCLGTVTWRCGDGNLDDGEVCDDGELNNTPRHCNSDCTGPTPYCGDGKIQRENCNGYSDCVVVEGMSEECDDRYMNGAPGYCYEDCSGKCGDGTLNGDHGETCDDGGNNGSIGYCNSTCDGDTPVCGNGVQEKGEACDEGNDVNGKYGHCNSNCNGQYEAGYCGDNIIQIADAADCPVSFTLCDENTTENCCEVVEFATGDSPETCDEGDKNDYHGHCNKYCNGTASCGNGNVGKDEICEPGSLPQPMPCSMLTQFTGSNGMVSACDEYCMPILTDCDYDTSYTSPFFKTGQTLCYSNDGTITCPTTEISNISDFYGQDQDLQFPHTAHNFVTTEESPVITETVSGLMWQKITPEYYGYEKGESIIYDCSAETYCTLAEASAYCSHLILDDHIDWRLPTAAEFSTIMNYASTTHIYSGFGETTHGSYWTSDGIVFSTADGTSSIPTAPDPLTAQVKCVRFTDNMSGCTSVQCLDKPSKVVDLPESIMTIYKNTVYNFWYFEDLVNGDSWENALLTCKDAGINGVQDMRLPTVNELMSLIDRENGGSLISGFTGKAWTSTTRNGFASEAYAVDFSDGSVVLESKEDTNKNIVICIE